MLHNAWRSDTRRVRILASMYSVYGIGFSVDSLRVLHGELAEYHACTTSQSILVFYASSTVPEVPVRNTDLTQLRIQSRDFRGDQEKKKKSGKHKEKISERLPLDSGAGGQRFGHAT